MRICKIPAKADAATLLFDPREIDFIESMNKANYVSVRGELYQTSLTMEELDGELAPFGFFRCHRSYIVNVSRSPGGRYPQRPQRTLLRRRRHVHPAS